MYAAIPFFVVLAALLLTVPLIATVFAFRHARSRRKALKRDMGIVGKPEPVDGKASSTRPVPPMRGDNDRAQGENIEMTHLPFARPATRQTETSRPVSPLSQPDSVDLNPPQQSETSFIMTHQGSRFHEVDLSDGLSASAQNTLSATQGSKAEGVKRWI